MTASTLRSTWEIEQHQHNKRNGTLQHVEDKAGPTALVLNLTQLSLDSALSSIKADVAKEHPGVRVTFVILRMLNAGFSSVQVDGEGGGKRGSGGGKYAAKSTSSALRPRYGTMENGSVLLHSYELINKKGTYSKGGLSESFVCISPGMVISTKVFGNKMVATFGKGDMKGLDIAPFQLAVVQFGTRSMASTSVESGNMLDIKSMHMLQECTIDNPRIIPMGVICKTMADTTARREGFMAGLEVAEHKREHCSMSMMRCALATSFFPLDFGLLPRDAGVFAISPDGNIRFHASVPMADIQPSIFNIKFDPRIHGTSDAFWTCRLFNVAMKFGAVRIIAAYDAYRNKNIASEDQTAQAYAHVDVLRLIEGVHSVDSVPLADSGDAAILAIVNSRAANAATNVKLFPECAPGIDVAVDSRALTRQMAQPVALSTVAHTSDASWARAHLVSVYQNKSLVLAFVVPLGGDASPAAACAGGATLSAIDMPDLSECAVQSDETAVQQNEVDEEPRGKKKARH